MVSKTLSSGLKVHTSNWTSLQKRKPLRGSSHHEKHRYFSQISSPRLYHTTNWQLQPMQARWTCLINSFSVLQNHMEGVPLRICRGVGPSTLRQVFARRIIGLRLIVRDQWTSPRGTHTWALVNSINHEEINSSIINNYST